MKKLHFTLFGHGHIGKRHAAIIQAMGEELTIIETRDEKREAREESNVQNIVSRQNTLSFASPGSAARSQEPEASFELRSFSEGANPIAVLATPNYLHCTQAIEAMKNGFDVLIEKPMGLNAAECLEVIKVSKELDRKVFCVMQNRYSPPSAWLKELIGSNRLGKIYRVEVNCYWNRGKDYYAQSKWKGKLKEDGGTLFTQFSHFVDTLIWLFGDLEPLRADFQNFNHPEIEFEDSGNFDFEIRSGGIGSFHYSTAAYEQNLESSITILAENGTVKVGGQYMEKVMACRVKDYEMPILEATLPPNNYGTYKGSASNHEYVYQNLIAVLNQQANIDCSAEEGLKVVAFIEKVYKWRG